MRLTNEGNEEATELHVIDLQKQRSNASTRPNVGVGLIVLNEEDEVLVGRRKGG